MDKSYLNRVRKLGEIPGFMKKAVSDIHYKERINSLKKKGGILFTEKGFEKVGYDIYKRTEEPNAGSIWQITTIKNANGEDEKWLVVYTDDQDKIIRQVKASLEKESNVDETIYNMEEIYKEFDSLLDNVKNYINLEKGNVKEGIKDWVKYDLSLLLSPETIDNLVNRFQSKTSSKKISYKPGTIVQVNVPHGSIYEKYNGKIGEVKNAVPDRSQVYFKDTSPFWFEDNTIKAIASCNVCNKKVSLQGLKTVGNIQCKCGASFNRNQLEKIAHTKMINEKAKGSLKKTADRLVYEVNPSFWDVDKLIKDLKEAGVKFEVESHGSLRIDLLPETHEDYSKIYNMHYYSGKDYSLGGFGSTSSKKTATIVPRGDEFCVIAESGRSMGCYPLHKQAEERLQQVEMFKHMKGEKESSLKKETDFKVSLNMQKKAYIDLDNIRKLYEGQLEHFGVYNRELMEEIRTDLLVHFEPLLEKFKKGKGEVAELNRDAIEMLIAPLYQSDKSDDALMLDIDYIVSRVHHLLGERRGADPLILEVIAPKERERAEKLFDTIFEQIHYKIQEEPRFWSTEKEEKEEEKQEEREDKEFIDAFIIRIHQLVDEGWDADDAFAEVSSEFSGDYHIPLHPKGEDYLKIVKELSKEGIDITTATRKVPLKKNAQNVILWFDNPATLKALKHLQGPPTSPANEPLGKPEEEIGEGVETEKEPGEKEEVGEKEAKTKSLIKKGQGVDSYGEETEWNENDIVRVRDTDGLAVIDMVEEETGEFNEPVQNIGVEFISGSHKGESDYFWSFNLVKVSKEEAEKELGKSLEEILKEFEEGEVGEKEASKKTAEHDNLINIFTADEAKRIGDSLGVNWTLVNLTEFTMGMNVEREHTGVVGEGNATNYAKIALDHLNELPDYYTRLHKMEEDKGIEKEVPLEAINEKIESVVKEATIKKAVEISLIRVERELVESEEFLVTLGYLGKETKHIEQALREWLYQHGYIVTEEEFLHLFGIAKRVAQLYDKAKKESLKKTADGMALLRGGGGAGSSSQLEPMNWTVKETGHPKLPGTPKKLETEELKEDEEEELLEEITITLDPETKNFSVDFGGDEGVTEEKTEETKLEGAQTPPEKQPQPIEPEEEEIEGPGESPVKF